MAERLQFEIVVDDKGTPVIRQFSDTARTAASDTDRLSGSFAAGAKQALGFGTAVLGFQGAATVVRDLARAYADFDAAAANVNTLIPRQIALQSQLRAELLQLPPALGSSAELARGLYDALSSGVRPAEAVQFVGDAARLARAGLADLDTATTALTKTMAVYGFEASDAAKISDVFFQVVNVGQGSLQQFASAFPNVLVAAKGLGVSFIDVSAALATLSASFKSPAEASTGLVTLLSQLSQHADEFAARGINIRQVIAEQGLAGALQTLKELTKGNADELRLYVSDIQGIQAALSLTGPQFDKFIENQQKVQAQTAPTAAALAEQQRSISASFGELTGAVGQYVAKAGDAIGVNQATSAVLSGMARIVTNIGKGFEDVGTAADQAARKLNAEAAAATAGFAKVEEAQARVTAEQVKAERQTTDLINAYKGFGVESNSTLRQLAEGAEANFRTILASGKEPPERLIEIWEAAAKKIKAATGSIPEFFARVGQDLILRAEEQKDRLSTIYEQLGIQSRSVLQLQAQAAIQQIKALLNDPDINPRHLLDAYLDVVEQINKAGFQRLPAEFRDVNSALQEIARKAGVELPRPYIDGLGQVAVEFRKVEQQAAETSTRIVEETAKAASATRALSEEARRLGHSFNEAGEEVNAYGNAIARLSDETDRLNKLQIRIEQDFPTTEQGLRDAIFKAQLEAQAIQFSAKSLAELEFFRRYYDDLLRTLTERLNDILASNQQGGGTTTPPPSRGGTGSIPAGPTGGSGGGSRPSSGLFNGFAVDPPSGGLAPPALGGTTRTDVDPGSLGPNPLPVGGTAFAGQGAPLPPAVQEQLRQLQAQYRLALAQGDRGRQAFLVGEFSRLLNPYPYNLNRVTGEVIYTGFRLRQGLRPAPLLVGSGEGGNTGAITERPGGGTGGDGYQGPGGSALPGVSLGPPTSGPSGPVDNVGAPIESGTRGGINIIIQTSALTRGGAQDLVDTLLPALREAQRRGGF